MRQIDIFITGKPCAGKDTISNYICSEFGFMHFRAGSYLKSVYEKEYGSDSEFMKDFYAGALKNARDGAFRIVNYIEKDLIKTSPELNNIVFDGYPRTLEQWNYHLELIDKRKNSLKIFLILLIDDEEVYSRCEKRYICLSCSRTQHSLDIMSQCMFCYSKNVIRRPDDTQDNLKERLKYYKEKTAILENLESDPSKKLHVYKIDVNKKDVTTLSVNVDEIIGQYYGS